MDILNYIQNSILSLNLCEFSAVIYRIESPRGVPNKGFVAIFKRELCAIILGIPGCGGVFTASSGEFGPPIQNGAYQRNLLCEYLIRMPTESRIQIKFKSFELEESRDCEFDYIDVSYKAQIMAMFHPRKCCFLCRFSRALPTKTRK